MTLRVEIPVDVEAALNADAAKAGVSPAEYAGKLLAEQIANSQTSTPPSKSERDMWANPEPPLSAEEIAANRSEMFGADWDADAQSDRPPLSARIRNIWAGVPEEAWAQLPADWADNMDHYVYGTPKKSR